MLNIGDKVYTGMHLAFVHAKVWSREGDKYQLLYADNTLGKRLWSRKELHHVQGR